MKLRVGAWGKDRNWRGVKDGAWSKDRNRRGDWLELGVKTGAGVGVRAGVWGKERSWREVESLNVG